MVALRGLGDAAGLPVGHRCRAPGVPHVGGGLRREPPGHRPRHGSRRLRASAALLQQRPGRIHPGRAQYTHLLDENGFVVDDIIVWWVDDERFDVMPNASNTSDVLEAIGGTDVTAQRAADRSARARSPRNGCPTCRPKLRRSTGSTSSASNGEERRAWLRAPATPVRTVSSARCRPRWRWVSGMPSSARASFQRGSGHATRCASRRACRCTAMSSARASPRSRPGWAGSSAGTRENSPAGTRSKRSVSTGPTRRLRGFVADGRQPLRDGAEVCRGLDRVGFLTSGNFSPMRERGIGLGFVDADAQLLDGDEVTVVQRGRALAAHLVRPPLVADPGRGRERVGPAARPGVVGRAV